MKTNSTIVVKFSVSEKYNSDNSKSFLATVQSEEEVLKFKEKYIKSHAGGNYTLTATECKNLPYRGVATLKQIGDEILETVLYKIVYTHTKTTVKVIQLPEGLVFCDGYLQLKRNVFKDIEMTHDNVLAELKLMQWIMDTFPTAVYGRNRGQFNLLQVTEEFIGTARNTKHQYVLYGNSRSVEIHTRIFKKTRIDINDKID